MNITILHENIQRVIQDLQKSIPSRPSLPILSCLLIQADESGSIHFSATDLNVGITAHFSGEVIEPGKVAVPAKVFIDFINSLEAGKLTLEVKDQTMKVISEGATAEIQCLSAEDYPTFPSKEGFELELPLETFTTAIQNTAFAASVDEARPIYTTVLLRAEEKQDLEVIATDGFRLATLNIPYSAQPFNLLIPAKGVQEVVRVALRKKEEKILFTVSEKLKQAFFSFGEVEILVRVMDGDYPPYQKIIPGSFSTQVTFDGGEFGQKLKTAIIFARESAGIVRLKIEQDVLKIISASSTIGHQESTVKIQLLSGGDQEIAFNVKYLSEFLQILKPEQVWFGMNEPLKPALFRPAGMENYRYIVMPFRLNQ